MIETIEKIPTEVAAAARAAVEEAAKVAAVGLTCFWPTEVAKAQVAAVMTWNQYLAQALKGPERFDHHHRRRRSL
jgi:hypothetical protein